MKLSMNISALLLALASVLTADGQPGRRRLDLRGQVFDLVFPTHSERSYFSKMVLRFSDTQSQLTVLVYTGGQTEIIRHRMSGVTAAELNGLTVKAFQDNTITPASIASKLKVDMSRVSVDYEQTVVPALEELKTIRLSPVRVPEILTLPFPEILAP